MKKVYLVHMYKNGKYVQTCSVVFTNRKAAQNYANDCIFCEVEEVELINEY